jgi:transposase
VASDGVQRPRFAAEHIAAGLREPIRRLLAAGVDEVGIERGDGPVVDALLGAGLTVFVIPSGQLNLRGRYGSVSTKDDWFDAYVLADAMRTDRTRLRALVCDSAQTVTLRATCRAKDLVAHRVALGNQPRAHLWLVFPEVVGLFREIDSPVSLGALTRFPHELAADWLSPTRLDAWLPANRHCRKETGAVLHTRLAAAPRGTTGAGGEARGHLTRALIAALRALHEQMRALETQIAEQLVLHPDAPIFPNLPKAGAVRAARLLSEVGVRRARFPAAQSLHWPSTCQSGEVRVDRFRWAADKQLRDAVCDFAGDSRHAHPWAAQLYNWAIARGHNDPHAVRILARAWLSSIWRCWQDHVPYDPTTHRGLQAVLAQRPPAAAGSTLRARPFPIPGSPCRR